MEIGPDAVVVTDGFTQVSARQASALAGVLETSGSAMACGPVVASAETDRVVSAGYELGLEGESPVAIPLLAGEAIRRRWASAVTQASRPSGGMFAVMPGVLSEIIDFVGSSEAEIVRELRRRGPWVVVWAAAHEHAEDPHAGSISDAMSRRDDGLGDVVLLEPPGPDSPGTPCPPPAALWIGETPHRGQAGRDDHHLPPVIAIRHAATDWGVAENWGDHHFAVAMANAFARVGAGARVVPRHAWAHPFAARDLVVTVRGLVPALPVVGRTNVLWVISHPDDIRSEELSGYDLIAVASDLDRSRVAAMTDRPVISLLQATDQAQFRDVAKGDGTVVFIGNSRGVRRRIVGWATQQQIPLHIYGNGWDDLDGESVVLHGPVDREAAADRFNSASVVLGDHWDDMRDLGYVSNRVFDVAASGGLLISDRVEGIERLLPGTLTADSAEELGRMVRHWRDVDARRRSELVSGNQTHVRRRHTFDHRARELFDAIRTSVPDGDLLVDRILDS